MAPRVYFTSYKFPMYNSSLLPIYFAIFILQSIQKNTKYIYLLSLSDLTFASGREGIDSPFIALVARFLFVCVGTRDLRVVSYWIDTLVLTTEGNTYATLLYHPFLFKGKPTHCSRGRTPSRGYRRQAYIFLGTRGHP